MNATAFPQLTQAQLTQAARQALTLMDLTSLNDSDTDSVIEALCQQVKTPFGNPAAVCVYPQFIVTAARALSAHKLESQVKIATVTNFPTAATISWALPVKPAKPWRLALTKSTWCFLTVR